CALSPAAFAQGQSSTSGGTGMGAAAAPTSTPTSGTTGPADTGLGDSGTGLSAPVGTTGPAGTTGTQGATLVGAVSMPSAPLEPNFLTLTGPVNLRVHASVWLGGALNFKGSVSTSYAGVAVTIQRYNTSKVSWTTVAQSTVSSDGTFTAS